MKKLTAVFLLGLFFGVVITLIFNSFSVQAEGVKDFNQYQYDHIYELRRQVEAINDLTREVKRIADKD